MNLKLEGEAVTGAFETEHTGKGTISRGSFKNNKISFTVDFANHESVNFIGELQNGKISGEFSIEGKSSTWEAVRKS